MNKMKINIMALYCWIFLIIPVTISSSFSDPDLNLNAIEFIQSRHFKGEIHQVITSDGYILNLHRIINKNIKFKIQRQPVLLMHGLLGSCVDYLYNSPGGFANESKLVVGNNLAFELAKRGFDVWMGNVRGNRYSSKTTSKYKKWDFSLDELIAYDLPSMIDHVLTITNSTKLDYIGFSQGTMIMFALLSRDQKFNEKINKFIAIAPVVYLRNVSPSVKRFLQHKLLESYIDECTEFLGNSYIFDRIGEQLCSGSRRVKWCERIIFSLSGYNPEQLNHTRVPVYLNHTPAGTSCKNIRHFMQLIFQSDTFRMYDYGTINNLKKYGQIRPPIYRMDKISLNNSIYLIRGANDYLVNIADVMRLKNELRVTLAGDYLVPNIFWSHLDHLWGKDAGSLVNSKILNILSIRRSTRKLMINGRILPLL